MRREYVLEKARETGRPSEIEDFEQASMGVAEFRDHYGRKGQKVGDRVYPDRGGKLRALARRV